MASVREIAKRAGVSAATVSRTLNNHPSVTVETRDRVLGALQEMHYTVTGGQRSIAIIGLMNPVSPSELKNSTYEWRILMGILRGLAECRCNLEIVNPARDMSPRETFTQFLFRKRLNGVLVRPFQPIQSELERLAMERFPHVAIAGQILDEGGSFVIADCYSPTVSAVEHLIELGHRRIAFVSDFNLDQDRSEQRRAFVETMRGAQLSLDPELSSSVSSDIAGGREAMTRLLALSEPPTAVVFSDAYPAIGAIHLCNERGVRVPEDISIIGFDDANLRELVSPKLTVVWQDAELLGFEAAQRLSAALLSGDATPTRLVLPAYFEVNGTTGAPRSR